MLLLQVDGVSGRRPGRTAGVLLVMTPLKTEIMVVKERADRETASETAVQSGGLNRPTPRVSRVLL